MSAKKSTTPTSQARIDANRRNALKSTGPTSDQGKAAVAANAQKHGFAARKLRVSDSDRPDFDHLEASLRREIQPEGALEEDLFQQLLSASWNLMQIDVHEARCLRENPEPFCYHDSIQALQAITRYRLDHTRIYDRCLSRLAKLQTSRAARLNHHPLTGITLSASTPLADCSRLTKQTQLLNERFRAEDKARASREEPSQLEEVVAKAPLEIAQSLTRLPIDATSRVAAALQRLLDARTQNKPKSSQAA